MNTNVAVIPLRHDMHDISKSVISPLDITIARLYLFYTCIFALVCSAWTLRNYSNGDTTMRAYAWIGTISSTMLLAGLLIELFVYRGCCRKRSPVAEQIRQRGVGVTMVHIASATICIFSVCAAAVNIYGNASEGLYGLSCVVLVVNWAYAVFYTPSTTMHLAVFSHVSEAEQYVLSAQQRSIRYVWRHSSVTPTESS